MMYGFLCGHGHGHVTTRNYNEFFKSFEMEDSGRSGLRASFHVGPWSTIL